MLAKPENGWSEFALKNVKSKFLSYISDLPFEWVEAAIEGLYHEKPFCIHGFMEPGRAICLVSRYQCYVITENEFERDLNDVEVEISPTNMHEFCKMLSEDLRKYQDEWLTFALASYDEPEESETAEIKDKFEERLSKLENLLKEREKDFYKK